MFLYITKNINPNYIMIPNFVEKNPKTALQICVLSKHNMRFSTTSTSNSPILLQKNNLYLIFFTFPLFSRTFPILNHPKSHHYDPKQQEFKIQTNKVP